MLQTVKRYILAHPTLRNLAMPVARVHRSIFQPERRVYADVDYLFSTVEEGTLSVRMPAFCGKFAIDCHSDILKRILVDREYETELNAIIRREIDPNRDAVDVGANVGLFTTLIASLLSPNSRLLAIEPTPGALKHLKRNLETNGQAGKVIVFEGAAADRAGEFTINVMAGMEEYSSLQTLVHPNTRGKVAQQVRVAGETLDALVRRHELNPGLIKIDTEGAELQVLRGAERTLLEHRPVVLCESWADDTLAAGGGVPGAVEEFFKACNYVAIQCGRDEIMAVPQERSSK
jgi:FkbM family methyltransferase